MFLVDCTRQKELTTISRRCGTVYCGVDIIVDELVHYQKAHRLPRARQDAIFKLAYKDFDDETMLGKTIFPVEDGHSLLKGFDNMFYKVEQVSSVIAASSTALIAGQQTQVAKIMLCNKKWLMNNYYNPINRNKSRIQRILRSQSVSDGVDALTKLLAQAMMEANSQHCDHCKGLDGPCACTEGCAAKSKSQCKVVHNAVCDGCGDMKNIEGPRYKCATCNDYDLCADCYSRGVHDKTHPFSEILRVGSTPERLSPRETRSNVHAPEAKSAPYSPTTVRDIPFASATPVGDVEAFREGQSVRFKGMSDPNRNGTTGQVVKVLGSRVVVFLQQEDKKITVRADNLEAIYSLIPVGTLIELKGLQSQVSLNERLAIVVDCNECREGKVAVQLLDDSSRVLMVKPSNCEIIEDET